jgi:hypothetical protein
MKTEIKLKNSKNFLYNINCAIYSFAFYGIRFYSFLR